MSFKPQLMRGVSSWSVLLLAAFAGLASSAVSAATIYWGGTPGTWNATTSWSTDANNPTPNPGAIPGSADAAIFNITTVNSNQNITLDADQAATSLTFNTTGVSNFLANASGTTARTLTLGSTGITVNSGAGPVTIGQAPATYGAVNITLGANQNWTNASTSLLALNGDVNLGTRTLTIPASSTGRMSIGGIISGSGVITNSGGSARLELSGTNTFTSNPTISGSSGLSTVAITSIADYGVVSALGAPASGSVIMGGGTNSRGRLEYVGAANGSSNRTFSINGTGAGGGGAPAGQIFNNGAGTLSFTASTFITAGSAGGRTLLLGGANVGSNEIRGVIQDGSGVINPNKTGVGTWVFGGNNTYTGTTTLNGGTLRLNYDTGANGTNTSKLSDTAALLLNGGILELSGGSHSEVVLSTTLNTGGILLQRTNGSTGNLSMGAITFTGGAIDFSADSIATTTTGVTNGILSQRATVAGTNFAMKSGSDIVAYDYVTSGSTGYTGAAMVANTNYLLTANGASSLAGTTGATTNTLKIANTGSGSLALAGGTLTVGAVLFAGSADYDITSTGLGRITPSILHNYGTASANLTLASLGGTLTQFGTGKTILSTNAQTNSTVTVNGGTVQFSNNLQIGTNSGVVAITLNRGTLLADTSGGAIALDNSGSNSRTVTLGAGGGTLDVIGGNRLTVSGVVSGVDNRLAIGSASSNGTVNLTAANTYSGGTTVIGGLLQVNNTTGSGTGTGDVSVGLGGSLGGNGTITGAVTVNGSVAPGNSIGILTVANDVTWSGNSSSPWVFELGASNTSDLLNVTGGGDSNFLRGSGIVGTDFVFDFAAGTDQGTFTLVSWTGTTNFAPTDFSYQNLGGGNTGSFQVSGNSLQFVVVPEPATLVLIAAGVGLVGLRIARRRRQ